MNLTLELLRLVGSPFAPEMPHINRNIAFKLYKCAKKNRMSYLCLEKLSEKGNLGELEKIHRKEKTKYFEALRAIHNVSKALNNSNIQHAVFKTLRPYKSTTVDIDILVFGNKVEYLKSIKSMQSVGYQILARGPRSVTLRDQKSNLGVDLYEQVAVSFVTYLDKEKLVEFVATAQLLNDEIKTLKPEADLVAIIAHSVIKEQMYTLSEYYTFIYYLELMDINNFIQILKQNNITSAARTHAAITALLHRTAHKTIPSKLQQILNSLGEETLETYFLAKNNFNTPHKYHMLTVARSLLEKMRDTKCRTSLATQILHMSNPHFALDFLENLTKHIARETY